MKSLAIDLDSGKLSRWIDDPRPFSTWSDKYGDLYTLRVVLYRSGGGRVSDTAIKFLVKKPMRRDVAATWSLGTFSRVPTLISSGIVVYEGQVSVSGASYRQALCLDASPGNDLPSAKFLGIIQASTNSYVTEVEFDYTVVNSGRRPVDTNYTGIYVGISDNNGLLIRNADNTEWRELVVSGSGANVTFSLGNPVTGPAAEITSLSDDYVRINNGILQIKNDDTGGWVNIILRGSNNTTITLGETPPIGFSLSTNRYTVDLTTGRLLLRNVNTGNWHEARIQDVGGDNVLALGNEYEDSANL